jgi:hypothetical protein
MVNSSDTVAQNKIWPQIYAKTLAFLRINYENIIPRYNHMVLNPMNKNL